MNGERRLITAHMRTGDTLPYLGAPPPVGYRLWQSHTRFVGFSLNPLNKQDWHNAPLCFPSFNRTQQPSNKPSELKCRTLPR